MENISVSLVISEYKDHLTPTQISNDLRFKRQIHTDWNIGMVTLLGGPILNTCTQAQRHILTHTLTYSHTLQQFLFKVNPVIAAFEL